MGQRKRESVNGEKPNSLATLDISLRNRWFPNLADDSFTYESKFTKKYNCVAWAVAITSKWIDNYSPYKWHPDIPRTQNLNSYIQYYETQAFRECNDGNYERGFDKIALYSNEYKLFKHISFQLDKNRWASKLGGWEDIYHNDVNCLSGGSYGSFITYMSRKTNWRRKLKRLMAILWIKILSIKF